MWGSRSHRNRYLPKPCWLFATSILQLISYMGSFSALTDIRTLDMPATIGVTWAKPFCVSFQSEPWRAFASWHRKKKRKKTTCQHSATCPPGQGLALEPWWPKDWRIKMKNVQKLEGDEYNSGLFNENNQCLKSPASSRF